MIISINNKALRYKVRKTFKQGCINGGDEIQPKKFGERNSREKKRERKRKRKIKKEGKEKKEGKKRKSKEKERGKKKVKIGEETLLKFAGIPLGKFLKINRYLKPEIRVFPRG